MKHEIQPFIHPDGTLNLKIKFVKENTLTACAQFLQSRIDQFTKNAGYGRNTDIRTFLHENVLTGPQL